MTGWPLWKVYPDFVLWDARGGRSTTDSSRNIGGTTDTVVASHQHLAQEVEPSTMLHLCLQQLIHPACLWHTPLMILSCDDQGKMPSTRCRSCLMSASIAALRAHQHTAAPSATLTAPLPSAVLAARLHVTVRFSLPLILLLRCIFSFKGASEGCEALPRNPSEQNL